MVFKMDAVNDVTAQLSESLNLAGSTPTPNDDGSATSDVAADSAVSSTGSHDNDMCDPFELSKLCFVVGHVAIKQISHMEAIETEWKRRKAKGMVFANSSFVF